jgi:MSHA biogenesis protein MshP
MKPFARRRRQARGVAIITAIFLLVAVAGLAVAIVTLTTTQQAGTAQDIQGIRAYQAAKAGIEWALYTAQQSGESAAAGSDLWLLGGADHGDAQRRAAGWHQLIAVHGDAGHYLRRLVTGAGGGSGDATAAHQNYLHRVQSAWRGRRA